MISWRVGGVAEVPAKYAALDLHRHNDELDDQNQDDPGPVHIAGSV